MVSKDIFMKKTDLEVEYVSENLPVVDINPIFGGSGCIK